MSSVTVTITNKKGLHARAAAKFVKVVAGAVGTNVSVAKLGQEAMPAVSGGSILGLMMLGADAGSKLAISAEGEKVDAVLDALKTLVEDKFGEGE